MSPTTLPHHILKHVVKGMTTTSYTFNLTLVLGMLSYVRLQAIINEAPQDVELDESYKPL